MTATPLTAVTPQVALAEVLDKSADIHEHCATVTDAATDLRIALDVALPTYIELIQVAAQAELPRISFLSRDSPYWLWAGELTYKTTTGWRRKRTHTLTTLFTTVRGDLKGYADCTIVKAFQWPVLRAGERLCGTPVFKLPDDRAVRAEAADNDLLNAFAMQAPHVLAQLKQGAVEQAARFEAGLQAIGQV